MNIWVVGAGAIGGWLAGALAQAGATTALIARGKALEAIRANGLIIRDRDEQRSYAIAASDRIADLPVPDAIVLTVKNFDFPTAVDIIAPAIRLGVAVVTAMNGLPWWFLNGLDGPLRDQRMETIDPNGRAGELLKEATAIAAVVFASTYVIEPGVIGITHLTRLSLGDAKGEPSAVTRELSRLMEATGVAAPISTDIRIEIWNKLWSNMSLNPISALTRLSSHPIFGDHHVARVLRNMMSEFAAVGETIGIRLPQTVEERWALTRKLGDFRTSMLTDAEAGKRLEIEGLLGVVIEIADRVGLDIPTCRTVYALAHGLNLRNS